jgi:transcription initiation factor TFIIIB Brf1 subunit/transcription initiation factor TFIIB
MNTADVFSQMNSFWATKSSASSFAISMEKGKTEKNICDGDSDDIVCSNNVCKDCGSEDFVVEEGIIICMNCSTVKEEQMIDTRSDKNIYGNNENRLNDPSHCGGTINPLLPKSSLGTIIVGKGNNMLKKIHNWTSMPYKERSLWKVFEDIQNRCNQNDLPQCISDKAKELYKVMSERKICRGKINEGVKANTVFFACKSKGVPRSDKECADMWGITLRDFNRGYKEFTYYMNTYLTPKDVKIIDSSDLIPRYCNKLQIPEHITDYIMRISKKVQKYEMLEDNTPQSVVGGIISYTCALMDYNINKYSVSTICNISPMTLNKIQSKLEENTDKLVKIKYVD